MQICVGMKFKVSNIFREGNICADKLANLGVDNKLEFFLYSVIPPCLSLGFFFNNIFHVLANDWWILRSQPS